MVTKKDFDTMLAQLGLLQFKSVAVFEHPILYRRRKVFERNRKTIKRLLNTTKQ